MTTTAHEYQFTDAPEPIREPLSHESILRRNVADLELALRTQTERAESYAETLRSLASYVGAGGYNADTVDAGVFEEKIRWGICEIMTRAEAAEAELAKAREQNPIKYLYRVTDCFGHDVLRDDPKGATILETIPLFAAPVTAPAMPYGIDEEAANRIALAVYDCKNGIKSDPLLHAINHILMKEIHPLSQEGLAQMQPTHQPVGNPDTLTPHEGATHCDGCGLTWLDDGLNPLGCPYCKDTVPAPAVPEDQFRGVTKLVVPDDWRNVMKDLADDAEQSLLIQYSDKERYPSLMIKFNNDMELVNRARALLQSAEVTK